MDNTVGNQDVGNDDLSTVDEDTAVLLDGDGDALAVEGLDLSAVLKVSGESDGAGNDVVLQNRGDVLGGGVGEGSSDLLEGLVGGGEDGQVGGLVDGGDEISGTEGTVQGSQVGGQGGLRGESGDGQDSVDDVDNTAGEVDVLSSVSMAVSKCSILIEQTYSSGDGSLLEQTRGKDNVAILDSGLEVLATSDVGVLVVGEESLDESRSLGDVGAVEGAVQDVVSQKSGNGSGVVGNSLALLGFKQSSEGIVGRSQDGDVLG